MLSLKMPKELELQLKNEAKNREMSVSALIRWIIKQYFENKNGREN